MARPRALVLTPSYPPSLGGVERLVHEVVSRWEALDAHVVAPAQPGGEAFDRDGGVRVHRSRVPTGSGYRLGIAALNAAAALEGLRRRPDVVVCAHVLVGPGAVAVARGRSLPMVALLHAEELTRRAGLSRFTLARAHAMIAVSRHTESLARGLGADPAALHRIAPGVTLPERAPDTGRDGRPTVVTVARLEDRFKGHDVMVEALARVRRSVPDVRWVVIGDGPLRSEYERLVRERGLEEQVRFTGACPDAERDAWLERAHVFAMPSRVPEGQAGEGFGIAYLEAAARGLPAVGGDAGGARDAIEHNRTGLLVDPDDPAAVAAALERLLGDARLREAMGRAAAERAGRCAWPEVARRFEQVVLDVVAAQRRSS